MKPLDTGLLILWKCAFIAAVLGEALPPDSIPIQCATICGPMVELSSICGGSSDSDIKVKLSRNRRRQVSNHGHGEVAERHLSSIQRPREAAGLAERDFTVLVPAPTSFPSSLLVQEQSTSPPEESRVTRIRPTPILPTPNPPPPSSPPPAPPPPAPAPPPAAAPPPPPASSAPPPPPPAPAPTQPQSTTTQNPPPITSTSKRSTSTTKSSTSTVDSTDDAGGDDDGNGQATSTSLGNTAPDQDQGQGGWMMNNGEKDCVCDNKSFNVPQVAALCSSCIAIANQLQNDMDIIMTACKFASESYSPDKDKVVNNVRVQATAPKQVWGQNAGVENGVATALTPIRSPLITVAAGLSLLQQWLLY